MGRNQEYDWMTDKHMDIQDYSYTTQKSITGQNK